MKSAKKPVTLIILDGWGHRPEKENNAIAMAKTPFFDSLWEKYPHSILKASGEAVGLPEGQMGNSEVGHITIGAGKTLDTDLVRITKAARDNEFISNPVFCDLFNHVKKYDSVIHIMGLIGPGGVHAHDDHLHELLKAAKKAGLKKIAIHLFTDGRDTPPKSAPGYIENLERILEKVGVGMIATATGRFYAMDRDKNWKRLAVAEKALFEGEGDKSNDKPSQAVRSLHKRGLVDEHLTPIIFVDDKGRSYSIGKNDGVIHLNFRADRARQLSRKIAEKKKGLNLFFVTMTQYDPTIDSRVAFAPEAIEITLASEISKSGLNQVHIAETEKFAHATYYLNGGREKPHDNEEHVLIESRKDIDTYDKAPAMGAKEICDKALEFVETKTPFIFINFANPDMVGHTGNEKAVILAIEEVDRQLARLIPAIEKQKGLAFITADHGNAEITLDENGEPHTAHTTNDVPAILVDTGYSLKNGALSDIAPTILELLNLPVPPEMTGHSLLK